MDELIIDTVNMTKICVNLQFIDNFAEIYGASFGLCAHLDANNMLDLVEKSDIIAHLKL